MKTIYKAVILSLFILLTHQAHSQIGIYTDTPDNSATLDINFDETHKGVLIPQLTTTQKAAITTPAASLLVYDIDKKCISQNIGSEAAPTWTCLTLFNRQFFYMPSINISTSTLGASYIDLYAQYKTEYGTPMFASVGAPALIPHYLSPTDLYYYVTYHDPTLIKIDSIDANGVMRYTTLKKANYDAYMNIVFLIK